MLFIENKTKKKGFTLIELVAVIAIIGILAAVLVPKFANVSESAKTTQKVADAREVIGAMNLYLAKNTHVKISDDMTMGNLVKVLAAKAPEDENKTVVFNNDLDKNSKFSKIPSNEYFDEEPTSFNEEFRDVDAAHKKSISAFTIPEAKIYIQSKGKTIPTTTAPTA